MEAHPRCNAQLSESGCWMSQNVAVWSEAPSKRCSSRRDIWCTWNFCILPGPWVQLQMQKLLTEKEKKKMQAIPQVSTSNVTASNFTPPKRLYYIAHCTLTQSHPNCLPNVIILRHVAELNEEFNKNDDSVLRVAEDEPLRNSITLIWRVSERFPQWNFQLEFLSWRTIVMVTASWPNRVCRSHRSLCKAFLIYITSVCVCQYVHTCTGLSVRPSIRIKVLRLRMWVLKESIKVIESVYPVIYL